MTESDFNERVDATLEEIEATLDDADTDLDYLISGGVLTIICENRSQLILTRQTPVRQLWLATRSGGYHFDYDADGDRWVLDSDGTSLAELLGREFAAQAGETLEFKI
ncbi:iron donor protein CyaY [Marinobacterium arenosum]|uniref:iron donor protein CyaY n=1 Tax=Marinobacterium arenosum TaxID=2862496 RepID=UPI001C974B32|nr:iron donor protein CyaY [Marinobacterium arenosum]MBY4676431.1 iron donor protein CyaY [Marinobacterium arenosum]